MTSAKNKLKKKRKEKNNINFFLIMSKVVLKDRLKEKYVQNENGFDQFSNTKFTNGCHL